MIHKKRGAIPLDINTTISEGFSISRSHAAVLKMRFPVSEVAAHILNHSKDYSLQLEANNIFSTSNKKHKLVFFQKAFEAGLLPRLMKYAALHNLPITK